MQAASKAPLGIPGGRMSHLLCAGKNTNPLWYQIRYQQFVCGPSQMQAGQAIMVRAYV
jgi:hypothetical protein